MGDAIYLIGLKRFESTIWSTKLLKTTPELVSMLFERISS